MRTKSPHLQRKEGNPGLSHSLAQFAATLFAAETRKSSHSKRFTMKALHVHMERMIGPWLERLSGLEPTAQGSAAEE